MKMVSRDTCMLYSPGQVLYFLQIISHSSALSKSLVNCTLNFQSDDMRARRTPSAGSVGIFFVDKKPCTNNWQVKDSWRVFVEMLQR